MIVRIIERLVSSDWGSLKTLKKEPKTLRLAVTIQQIKKSSSKIFFSCCVPLCGIFCQDKGCFFPSFANVQLYTVSFLPDGLISSPRTVFASEPNCSCIEEVVVVLLCAASAKSLKQSVSAHNYAIAHSIDVVLYFLLWLALNGRAL